MVEPITPNQVKEARQSNIPDFVIEVVNQMLIEHSGPVITLLHDEVAKRVRARQAELEIPTPEGGIYEAGWFDFEPLFMKAGWEVTYTKTGYWSEHPNYYTFCAR